jgi:hypothetical protein
MDRKPLGMLSLHHKVLAETKEKKLMHFEFSPKGACLT